MSTKNQLLYKIEHGIALNSDDVKVVRDFFSEKTGQSQSGNGGECLPIWAEFYFKSQNGVEVPEKVDTEQYEVTREDLEKLTFKQLKELYPNGEGKTKKAFIDSLV